MSHVYSTLLSQTRPGDYGMNYKPYIWNELLALHEQQWAPHHFSVVPESELLVDEFSELNLLFISVINFSVFYTQSTKVTSSWLLCCNSLSI